MTDPDAAGAAGLPEHFFRQESGRLVAALVRRLGTRHLDLAQEAVQEAMLRALRAWPLAGLPRDPGAWLARTARNAAIDALRRGARFRRAADALARSLESEEPRSASGRVDDLLRLIFLCCHPALSRRTQVALTLHIGMGFGAGELARIFLVPQATIAQRIVRAKRQLREIGPELLLPREEDAAARLAPVLDVLYLAFNEGYTPRDGDAPLRVDLAQDALRLALVLASHPSGDHPDTHALLALFCFQASRLEARIDATGALVPLEEQDRSSWDDRLVGLGFAHLARSRIADGATRTAAGAFAAASEYHLLAGIAACHASAECWEKTDWDRIVALYDLLVAGNRSPLLRLNRAVARMMQAPDARNAGDHDSDHNDAHAQDRDRDGDAVSDEARAQRGPAAALGELDALAAELADHPHRLAARADALRRLGRVDEAAHAYDAAARSTQSEAERRFLARRADALRQRRI